MNTRKLGFASLVVLNLIAIGVSAPADQVFNAAFAAITGGSINNTPIGAATASTGRFTTLTATGLGSFSGGLSGSGGFNFGGNATISTNSATAVTSICAGTTTGLCIIGGGANVISILSPITTIGGVAVVASKTCIAAAATLTIVNGLVTATSGC